MTWWRIDPAKGYRWYTVDIQSGYDDGQWTSFKLGPVSVWRYTWDSRPAWGVSLFGHWCYDSEFGVIA